MKASTRGRPQEKNNVITVHALETEYLSTKKDKFDTEIAYFKIIDSQYRHRLKPLFDVNDKENGTLKLPLWHTNEEDVILKVKSKWINVSDDLIQQELYYLNIDFTSYTLEVDDSTTVQGYYAKISKIKRIKTSSNEIIEVGLNN